MAKAIGRILVSYKEVQSLAGYTTLVYEMKQVLDDLESGHYKRTMLKSQDGDGDEQAPKEKEVKELTSIDQGVVVLSENIRFDKVPLVSPNGDKLAESVTFEIQPGMNLMIVGPNGCGKSSLFRILGSLWPLFGGQIHKPNLDKIFYIPQVSYLASSDDYRDHTCLQGP